MSSDSHTTKPATKKDAVELKKAIATGTVKESSISSRTSTQYLITSFNQSKVDNISVPPIICYCIASILMTVVNKVSLGHQHYKWSFLTSKSLWCLAHNSR